MASKSYNIMLRLPRSLGGKLKQIAAKEGVSINQFIGLAVTERVTRWEFEHEPPRPSCPNCSAYMAWGTDEDPECPFCDGGVEG